MLNSLKKNCTLCDKKINIPTLVLSEKKILNETKTIPPPPPPCKLNGRFLSDSLNDIFTFYSLCVYSYKSKTDCTTNYQILLCCINPDTSIA